MAGLLPSSSKQSRRQSTSLPHRACACVTMGLVLASCAPLGPRAISFNLATFDANETIEPSVRSLLEGDPLVVFAMFHIANKSGQGLSSPTPSYFNGLEPEFEIARQRLRTLPPDVYARFVEEVDRARALEPDWNDVHYSWGFMFGFLGLSAERTFDILDGWEQFEHNTAIGKGLGFRMGEGPFDYLWDLDHGMAGYGAGANAWEDDERMLAESAVAPEATPAQQPPSRATGTSSRTSHGASSCDPVGERDAHRPGRS